MLHDWVVEEREYLRHEARRGSRYAFSEIDPRQSALVVIDMVPFFVQENPYAHGIVPNVQRLSHVVRSAGGVVSWVLPSTSTFDPVRAEFYGDEIAERYRSSGGCGPLRGRLWHEFDVANTDLIVEKRSPGAFFPGGCALPDLLRERGVDTVFVTGTVANVCCESSIREASSAGFRSVMVADANAAVTDADLNATLRTVYRSFGDVRSTEELIALLRGDSDGVSVNA